MIRFPSAVGSSPRKWPAKRQTFSCSGGEIGVTRSCYLLFLGVLDGTAAQEALEFLRWVNRASEARYEAE